MELSIHDQIFEQISHAKKIVIALPEVLTAAALASGLALLLFLKKLEKDASVVSSGKLPENLEFLPNSQSLTAEMVIGKSLAVLVDTTLKKVDEISYQTAENKLSIFLKGKDTAFTPQDISFASEKFPLDLLIILDCKSLDDLGKLFEKNADLFFETPTINIDNKAGNEYFGAINLVDITASAVAEVLAGLFEKYEKTLLDEDIATCLLTGIITRTNSFQHAQTTPKAFLKASELIALGGRQQEIIKNIFKTKSLPLLKLWGRALARLKLDDENSTVYSLLNLADFAKAEADNVDLTLVIKELFENIYGYKIVGLICEIGETTVRILAALHAQIDQRKFMQALGVSGKLQNGVSGPYKILDVSLPNTTLAEAESKFAEAAKNVAS